MKGKWKQVKAEDVPILGIWTHSLNAGGDVAQNAAWLRVPAGEIKGMPFPVVGLKIWSWSNDEPRFGGTETHTPVYMLVG